jgi:hypothetical protein
MERKVRGSRPVKTSAEANLLKSVSRDLALMGLIGCRLVGDRGSGLMAALSMASISALSDEG